jgi:hypothetical protein
MLEKNRKILGWERTNHTGFTQSAREKEIIEYHKDHNRHYFMKRSSLVLADPTNIHALEHEAQLLRKLKLTGVVPEVIRFRRSNDNRKARLVLTSVEGRSLDKHDYSQGLPNDELEVIYATSASHHMILDQNVAITDVNQGTYMISRPAGTIRASLVDFEFGLQLGTATEQQEEKALLLYQATDPWMRLQPGANLDSRTDLFNKAEITLWTHVMVDYILGDLSWRQSPELSETELKIIQENISSVKPLLSSNLQDIESSEIIKKFLEQDGLSLPDYMVIANANLQTLLPIYLRMYKVALPSHVVTFMQSSLDPQLESRPSSFTTLHSLTGNPKYDIPLLKGIVGAAWGSIRPSVRINIENGSVLTMCTTYSNMFLNLIK